MLNVLYSSKKRQSNLPLHLFSCFLFDKFANGFLRFFFAKKHTTSSNIKCKTFSWAWIKHTYNYFWGYCNLRRCRSRLSVSIKYFDRVQCCKIYSSKGSSSSSSCATCKFFGKLHDLATDRPYVTCCSRIRTAIKATGEQDNNFEIKMSSRLPLTPNTPPGCLNCGCRNNIFLTWFNVHLVL